MQQVANYISYFWYSNPYKIIVIGSIFIISSFFIILLAKKIYQIFISKRARKKTTIPKSYLFITSFLSIVVGLIIGFFFNDYINFKYEIDIIQDVRFNSKNEKNHVFGIDVSHYQGKIDWEALNKTELDIGFVFIRATMGKNGSDKEYLRNWENAKKYNYIRGAYHYYRPNETSEQQFKNFSKTVTLEKGDFPPILDVEKSSYYGRNNLRKGVLNWLKLAEQHYKVKPIIYSGETFYIQHLKDITQGYPLWIASYRKKNNLDKLEWSIHQFSDKIKVKGIKYYADGNNFNGTKQDLMNMCIK